MSPAYRRRRQPRVNLDRGYAAYEAEREAARHGDGRFGAWPRDEVALDLIPPASSDGTRADGYGATGVPDPRDGLPASVIEESLAALGRTNDTSPAGALEADRATALVLTADWEPPIEPSRVPPWEREAATLAYEAWVADPPDPTEFRDAAREGELPDAAYELNAAEADRARRMVLALAADAHRNLRWAARLGDESACAYWRVARGRYCAHFGRLYWGAAAGTDLGEGHPAADLADRMAGALGDWFDEHGPGGAAAGRGDAIPHGVRSGHDEQAYREFIRLVWDRRSVAEANEF